MTIPYERIIQWAAGPTAIVAGFLGTLLITKVHFLGNLGLDQKTTAADIGKAITFAVGTGVTYAAHHKWLDNLSKWWTVQTPAEPLPAFTEVKADPDVSEKIAAGS